MTKLIQDLKIGILGSGQLGKMLCIAGAPYDLDIYTMDNAADSPAAKISNFTLGNIRDFDDVVTFGKDMDIITIEIENVNIEALKKLEAMGKIVRPSTAALEKITDKGIQRQFYAELGLLQPTFGLFESKHEILDALKKDIVHLPFVQKYRTEGYDGKGVQIIRTEEALDNLWNSPSIVESCIDIAQEISIIVARSPQGIMAVYPAVDMIFNDQNLVDFILCPAKIDIQIEKALQDISFKIAEGIKIEGLLAIEYFISKNGLIYVNEMAPRPHNSGHHTIEGNITSQYEQHLRAIIDLPLGSTNLVCPVVTANLLGAPNHTGRAYYQNLDKILKDPLVKVHFYNKKMTKPHRKMGHLTVMDDTLESAYTKAKKAKETLKIIAK